MEVINDIVGYNNLKIYQNDDWFKFSLESVLLPNFVTLNQSTHQILDLCTGNAPIPIILSTKTKAMITGVEIQKDICDLANKSILINNLDKQVKILNMNVKDLKNYYESDQFDLITVNPPYFKDLSLSSKNLDEHKKIARHEVLITLEEIIDISRKLLKNNGRLAIVHRTERLLEITNILEKNNLIPKKIQFIYPKIDKESNLFMIEAVKNGQNGVKLLPPLFIHNEDGSYREEILKIFGKEE